MTLEELEAEAMKLDLSSRIELARRLTAGLPISAAPAEGSAAATAPPSLLPPPPTDEEKERAWLQEALRRSRELRERQVQTEPPEPRAAFQPPAPGGERGSSNARTSRFAAKPRVRRVVPRKPKRSPSRPKAKPKRKLPARRAMRPAPTKRSASRPKSKSKAPRARRSRR